MEIRNNVPFEVTKKQRDAVLRHFSFAAAHREENGKYFLKFFMTGGGIREQVLILLKLSDGILR